MPRRALGIAVYLRFLTMTTLGEAEGDGLPTMRKYFRKQETPQGSFVTGVLLTTHRDLPRLAPGLTPHKHFLNT